MDAVVVRSNAHKSTSDAPSTVLPLTLGRCAKALVAETIHQYTNVQVKSVRKFVEIRHSRGDMLRRFIIACILVCASTQYVTYAQELNATVRVDMSQLQLDDRTDVRTMEGDIKTYLNAQRYTRDEWEGERIPVDVTVYLFSKNGSSYSARLTIVSRRLVNNNPNSGSPLLRVYDKEWSFNYTFSPSLSFQSMRYDEFTSVLDFYMLIAIGMDMDTYEDLGGDRLYTDAKQIAQLGNAKGLSQFSSNYQPGEYTRMALITDLTDPRYQDFRRLMYDYHVAVDEYELDKDKGRSLMTSTIKGIADFKRSVISNRSVLLQAFFDAKSGEIADMFRGIKESTVWKDLLYVDPGNTQLYEAARSGQ